MTREAAVSPTKTFTKGLLVENPSLRQMLGLCPTLAVTTAVTNGLGMGLATTFVLVCSEVVVSLLRKVIPDSVRIPAFITIIASFVTLTMMLVKAYVPALDDALGIYLPLIVVNCIVLGRAEMFASKHGPVLSALDGLGMGLGFTVSLVLMSAIRELLGAGTLVGIQVMPSFIEPMIIMVTPAGGFAVLGVLIAISVWLERRTAEKKNPDASGKPQPTSDSLCAACPLNCGVNDPNRIACADGDVNNRLEHALESVDLSIIEAAKDAGQTEPEYESVPRTAHASGSAKAARPASAARSNSAAGPASPARSKSAAQEERDA